ncbi:hypothetical protein IV203_016750 [Nitzschia inconspicua]|uniref:Uncharacterized protein n=1 Tax=Nitzschia inconspicua TaxID=303405 RepID=A0A9K3KRR5_9STRA|nr:hypothetical protein IV203_016750 [Nitzschia inconspicua]
MKATTIVSTSVSFLRISENIWRQAACDHSQRIHQLLGPGLTPPDHPLNSGFYRKINKQRRTRSPAVRADNDDDESLSVTALDPKHPIFNFLIEYYGLKGSKGVKRLMRWSPDPALLLDAGGISQQSCAFDDFSRRSSIHSGILLEGASDDDLATTLHLRGANLFDEGVYYSPSLFFASSDKTPVPKKETSRVAAPFLWYQSILEQTLDADPILHCYGLHEWAMQYQPPGAPPPPSEKYQQHLPLRVSRDVLNETVERKGVSCTHVDALRFFADAALPFNQFGGPLSRSYQLRLEQPACVHATMDLLKMTLKLQPFCDATLLQRVLQIALEARRLDVSASPYDASAYGVGVIPIETSEGRAEYKRRQVELMTKAIPVRRELLDAYNCFLSLAFAEEDLVEGRNRLPNYVA